MLSLDTYTVSALSPSFNSPSILNFYKNRKYYQFFGYANISFGTDRRIRNPELADGTPVDYGSGGSGSGTRSYMYTFVASKKYDVKQVVTHQI